MGPWIGKKVVTKYGAPVGVGAQKPGPDRVFRVYTVQEREGDRLQIVSESASGWIEATKVVPIDEAIDFYSQEIRAKPTSAAAYHQRGLIWKSKGENDKAIADFTDAIRIDPSYAGAYANRGGAWAESNEPDKAVADFTEAIRLDPRHARAYFNRGVTWSKKNDYDKAIADFSEAIRINPRHTNAYKSRGLAWSCKEEHDKAIADYSQAIHIDPRDALVYRARGIEWSGKKEYDKAIADYSQAIHIDPRDDRSYNECAWIWSTCLEAKFRDGKKAVESATRACELTEWQYSVYLETLAAACAEAGDLDAAVKWQAKANALHFIPEARASGETRLKLYQEKKPYRDDGP